MSGVRLITLGCRLNAYESEVMRGHAAAAGLDDAVIVNTCAVTAEAVRQAAQTIRKVRRDSPAARIIVTGCAAQIEPERFADMPEVDAVVGNGEKMKPETFRGLSLADTPRVQVNDIMSVRETAHAMIAGFGSRARAYVEVQNGCDHRCTFCIIPYGRGPSRSVPAGEVVAQVRRLVEAGYPEIVLTGVDITSYGADLPGGHDARHAGAPRAAARAGAEAPAAVIDRSGRSRYAPPGRHRRGGAADAASAPLPAVGRRHDPEAHEAAAFAGGRHPLLRAGPAAAGPTWCSAPTSLPASRPRPRPCSRTRCDLVDECGLTFLHVFPFSPRAGTPAARMPQVSGRETKARAARLREQGKRALAAYLQAQVGRSVELLMERDGLGRTPAFAEVTLDGPAAARDFVLARVTRSDGSRLQAERLAPKCAS